MPYNHNVKHNTSPIFIINRFNIYKSPKKILIEFSELSIVVLLIVILFKTFSFVCPDYVIQPSNISELLLSLPGMLRDYPPIIGILMSFLTWHIMYFDSAVPGINPPTPLSPTKYRAMSGADFHLNYLFALLVGPLTAALFYFGLV